MSELQSQTARIRAHLESGNAITPLEALDKYGCFRLGARIYDLRRDGMDIEREWVERNGKRFASYRQAGGETFSKKGLTFEI